MYTHIYTYITRAHTHTYTYMQLLGLPGKGDVRTNPWKTDSKQPYVDNNSRESGINNNGKDHGTSGDRHSHWKGNQKGSASNRNGKGTGTSGDRHGHWKANQRDGTSNRNGKGPGTSDKAGSSPWKSGVKKSNSYNKRAYDGDKKRTPGAFGDRKRGRDGGT
jgi:hypothetical protein